MEGNRPFLSGIADLMQATLRVGHETYLRRVVIIVDVGWGYSPGRLAMLIYRFLLLHGGYWMLGRLIR